MSGSALVLGLLGICGSFMPDEVLGWIGAPGSQSLMLLVQVLGALYLGFAALNWMARYNLIGGIYSRPVVIGNLLHFVSAAITMIKVLTRNPEPGALWPLTAVYLALAISFGGVLFRHPVRPAAES